MVKICVALLFMGLFFIGCESKPQMKKEEQVPKITVVSPFLQNSSANNEMNGMVESPKVIQIKNRIDGFIENQYFSDGSFVKAGDMLYKIDDRKLKNELASLNATVLQSKLTLSNLEKNKARIEKLLKIGGATEQELDNISTQIEKEKALNLSLDAQSAKLKLDISFTSIKAPISGYVEKSQQQVGAFVQAGGSNLTQIYSANPLYFSLMLPSSDDKPQNGEIIISNNKFTGNLKYCDPVSDSSGMVKCRYEFSSKEKIYIGTMGKFTYKSKPKEGLFLPQECLVQGKDGRSVYVIKNNTAKITKIETKSWVEGNIEVVAGVTQNDLIAKTGIVNLKDKAKVQIVK